MNGLDFLAKINDIDDSLIDEAARKWSAPEKAAKPKPWVYIAAGIAAAAAIILLIIGLNAGGGRTPDGNGTALVSAVETETSTEAKTTKPTETTPSATTTTPASAESNTVPNSTATDDHGESDDDNNAPAPAEPEPDTDPYDDDNSPARPDYRVMYIESFVDDVFSEDEDAHPAPEDTVAFWEDGTHTYYMSQERLSQTFVTYENGEVEDLVTALENGHIEISDLDTFGVPYYLD